MRILVVEDDMLMANVMCRGLTEAGFAVDHMFNAEHAEHALKQETFDLALVDLGLPGKDGFALVRRLRDGGNGLPVLIVTARDALDDRVKALDLGADDYLLKPFALRELVARSRALIRRAMSAASSKVTIGPLHLDLARKTAIVNESGVELTRREWAVLECLALNAGRVVSKTRLMQAVAGWDDELSSNAIEVYIFRLRAKFGAAVLIKTIRGIGYRLDDAST
ncbi:MAG: response regulator transcription factor [Rudaea sp.]|nr:response regulator transcription factor [Rudaea sp.]